MAAADPRQNHILFNQFTQEADIDGLLELYAEDAVYVPTRGERLHGRGEIRPMLVEMANAPIKPTLELID